MEQVLSSGLDKVLKNLYSLIVKVLKGEIKMKEKIKNIIADVLDVELEDVKDEAHIMDDLDADSIAVMEIVMELEEELDVEVPTEDILELNTVADIVAYIEKQ